MLGDLARGWQGFAWRWRADAVPPHGLALPEWAGEPLAGRHLLVHAEQGLGDTLQFVRFLPRLRRLAPESVTLLCQPVLTELLRDIPGADRVIGPEDDFGACDLRVPLLDLPLRLGVALADLSDGVPYLDAKPALTEIWHRRLGRASGKRVGLVWKGRPQHANDRNRSMRLDMVVPLFALEGVSWVSLQKDPSDAERGLLAGAGVRDLGDELLTLDDTAAVIAGCELVVSVDTSVAHLAGALGKPVWILLPMVPDWRWLMGRADTPWYPSAKLFRQPARGDWTGVVNAVARDLNAAR